eukprot:5189278-Pyramimonas_sp.AAC.2
MAELSARLAANASMSWPALLVQSERKPAMSAAVVDLRWARAKERPPIAYNLLRSRQRHSATCIPLQRHPNHANTNN